MAIIEVVGQVTHKSLMGKRKDELAYMYLRLLRETAQDAKDAERYRHLRRTATVRSDCGQWAVSVGDDWLPVAESDKHQPLHANTEAERCSDDLCDAAFDMDIRNRATRAEADF
jgi:hypothetical protein